MILIGLLFLSFALILVTQLVVWQVLDTTTSILVSTFVGILILFIWWLFPLFLKKRVGD
ncbi:MAG: hypothetical protein IPG53_14830 [Ignavibacteriales bacterium]|nr:hypothetical protein [Ignavibacteriales bacterium]